MRIGVTGAENSHVTAILRHLTRLSGGRGELVVGVLGANASRRDELRALFDIEWFPDHPKDMLGQVDVAFVCDRDGAAHSALALPLLHDGVDVYVDKPFAHTVSDALTMLVAAAQSGARLTSYSPLRFEHATLQQQGEVERRGVPHSVTVRGPLHSPEVLGFEYYASHHCEVATALTAGSIGSCRTSRTADGEVMVVVTIGETRVRLEFTEPTRSGDFSVQSRWGPESLTSVFDFDDTFFSESISRFLSYVDGGKVPVAWQQMIRSLSLQERVVAGLKTSWPPKV